MNDFFSDNSSEAISLAIEANQNEKIISQVRALEGECFGPNPLWFISDSPISSHNGVISFLQSNNDSEHRISTIIESFNDRGKAFNWLVGPSSKPENIGKYLQKHGLLHYRDRMGMAIELKKIKHPPNDKVKLTFAEVKTEEDFKAWHKLFLRGFNIDIVNSDFSYQSFLKQSLFPKSPWLHFTVKNNDGKIMGISSLFSGAGVSGLYNVVVDPQIRNKGIGTWITINSLVNAKNKGFKYAILQTSAIPALRLYNKLGFQVYTRIQVYKSFL